MNTHKHWDVIDGKVAVDIIHDRIGLVARVNLSIPDIARNVALDMNPQQARKLARHLVELADIFEQRIADGNPPQSNLIKIGKEENV